MLVRLCSVPAATEELARKDDLTLLFSNPEFLVSSAQPPVEKKLKMKCWSC
jgi:hypothetical protein